MSKVRRLRTLGITLLVIALGIHAYALAATLDAGVPNVVDSPALVAVQAQQAVQDQNWPMVIALGLSSLSALVTFIVRVNTRASNWFHTSTGLVVMSLITSTLSGCAEAVYMHGLNYMVLAVTVFSTITAVLGGVKALPKDHPDRLLAAAPSPQ